MLKKLTLNENYFAAALFYFGVGVLFLAITPPTPNAFAVSGDACGGTCEDGMICVQVGEGYECQCPAG